MKLKECDMVGCDVLIIGGGGAGLRAAIEAREFGAEVVVVSKSRVGFGNNTFISKATFAAAAGLAEPRDNPEVHLKDTLTGGRFINDQKLVAAVSEEAGDQISFLEKCDVSLLKRKGSLSIAQLPGHSYPRHVRSEHQRGSDFMVPLRRHAQNIGVRFAEHVSVTRLFVSSDRIAAAGGIGPGDEFHAFRAKCVILATGGFAQAYLHTNNAPGMTGDGHVLAFELGIPLKDMEFIQFYPIALGRYGNRFISYETLIVEAGAVLRNSEGKDILVKHGLNDPMIMTRDRLARAIMKEILEGRGVEGGVIMDLSTIPKEQLNRLSRHVFGSEESDCKEINVSPTAHFCMGGVMVDEHAETIVPGLFAAGEVCAGVHGANRLGGNALSEVFAIGGIAGRRAAQMARKIGLAELPEKQVMSEKARLESLVSGGKENSRALRQFLKQVMWYKAGIIRTAEGLQEALAQIRETKSELPHLLIKDFRDLKKSLELHNIVFLNELVCRAALMRTESRGAHYRRDYPEEDNVNWLKNIVISKRGSGVSLEQVAVTGN